LGLGFYVFGFVFFLLLVHKVSIPLFPLPSILAGKHGGIILSLD